MELLPLLKKKQRLSELQKKDIHELKQCANQALEKIKQILPTFKQAKVKIQNILQDHSKNDTKHSFIQKQALSNIYNTILEGIVLLINEFKKASKILKQFDQMITQTVQQYNQIMLQSIAEQFSKLMHNLPYNHLAVAQ